jgi:hypothetical protein
MAKLRIWFGLLGMLDCLWAALYFAYWQIYPTLEIWMLFPQPGINMLEIIAVGILGLVSILKSWRKALAACCGVLLTFVILGAWTIGFFLIPALLLFAISLITSGRPAGRPAWHPLVFFLGAAILQTAALLIPFYL